MATARDVLDSVTALLGKFDTLLDDGRFRRAARFLSAHHDALATALRHFEEAHQDDAEVRPAFGDIVREADATSAAADALRPDRDEPIESFGRSVKSIVLKLAEATTRLPATLAAPEADD